MCHMISRVWLTPDSDYDCLPEDLRSHRNTREQSKSAPIASLVDSASVNPVCFVDVIPFDRGVDRLRRLKTALRTPRGPCRFLPGCWSRFSFHRSVVPSPFGRRRCVRLSSSLSILYTSTMLCWLNVLADIHKILYANERYCQLYVIVRSLRWTAPARMSPSVSVA